jgi:hypothetical protein
LTRPSKSSLPTAKGIVESEERPTSKPVAWGYGQMLVAAQSASFDAVRTRDSGNLPE